MTSAPRFWLPDHPEQAPPDRLMPDPGPEAVLGYQDGPILFTGQIDGQAVLAALYAAEIEEAFETHAYCAVPVTPEVMAALRSGAMTVYAAYQRVPCSIIVEHTDDTGTTHRSWAAVIPPDRILAGPEHRLKPVASAA